MRSETVIVPSPGRAWACRRSSIDPPFLVAGAASQTDVPAGVAVAVEDQHGRSTHASLRAGPTPSARTSFPGRAASHSPRAGPVPAHVVVSVEGMGSRTG